MKQDEAGHDAEQHVRLPSSRFYWAILVPEGDAVQARACPPREVLTEMLADHIPLDVAEVHAAFVSIGECGILACALRADELDALDAKTRTLGPTDVPEAIAANVSFESISHINLLEGVYEPNCVRDARRAVTVRAVWAMAAIFAAVGVGLHVRAAQYRTAAAVSMALAERCAVDALAASGTAGEAVREQMQSDHRLAARVAQCELVSQLERERGVLAASACPPDAAGAMACVLAQWPKQLATRIESLAIGEKSIRLTGTVAKVDDASVLAEALNGVPGWVPEQPQVAAQADRVSIRASWSRVATVNEIGSTSWKARAAEEVATGGTP
jgi:hypothetical protein